MTDFLMKKCMIIIKSYTKKNSIEKKNIMLNKTCFWIREIIKHKYLKIIFIIKNNFFHIF